MSGNSGHVGVEVGKAVAHAVNNGKWHRPFVMFNNQDTVLMTKYMPGNHGEPGLVALMNETRVFSFGQSDKKSDADAGTNETARDMVLNVLTTPKYRVLSSMFLIFRLLDNAVLFTFILMLFTRTGDPFKVTEHDLWLAGVISIELFYDLMLMAHRFWFLNRLSLHVGLIFYIAYALLIFTPIGITVKPEDIEFVGYAYFIRLAAFIHEELVMIVIDMEVHNDLIRLQEQRDGDAKAITKGSYVSVGAGDIEAPAPNVEKTQKTVWEKVKGYLDVKRPLQMSDQVEYLGSFFAFGAHTTNDADVWRKEEFGRLWLLLIWLPILITALLLAGVVLFCLVAVLIMYVFSLVLAIFKLDFDLTTLGKLWKDFQHF